MMIKKIIRNFLIAAFPFALAFSLLGIKHIKVESKEISKLNLNDVGLYEPVNFTSSTAWWTLSDDHTTLHIGGTGQMDDFASKEDRPWNGYAHEIISLSIDNTITYIGDHAFEDLDSITHIILPNSVTSIGDSSFKNCDSISSLSLPSSVEVIKAHAFENCTNIQSSITFRQNVSYLGESAFANCDGISSFIFQGSVSEIPTRFAYDCDSLMTLSFNDNINRIGDYAFANCDNLAYMYFTSTSLSSLLIGGAAFDNCVAQGMIYIPAGYVTDYTNYIINASNQALEGWIIREKHNFINTPTAWWTITQDGKSLHIGGAGEIDDYEPDQAPWKQNGQFKNVEEIVIGDYITKIGSYSFDEAFNAHSIIIGKGVTTIGESAFAFSTKLGSIVIPEHVQSIDDSAFYRCNKLVEISFLGETAPYMHTNAFNNISPTGRLYYPYGSVASYGGNLATLSFNFSRWDLIPTKAQAPESNIESGTYNSTQYVSLSSSSPGVTILYTLDGSTPDETSIKYVGPIEIKSDVNNSKTTVIKAIAVRDGWTTSDVSTYTYKIKCTINSPIQDFREFFYTGEEQTFQIEENEHYLISGNKQTLAGEYDVTLSLIDPENYVWDTEKEDDIVHKFIINKGVYDMSNVKYEDLVTEYNGQEQALLIEGDLPTGVSVSYEGNTGTTVGKYKGTASFTGDTDNYEEIPSMTAQMTINKIYIPLPSEDVSDHTYNGQEQTYNIPESEYYTIEGNKKTTVGNYTVVVSLNDKVNTVWENGFMSRIEFEFNITKATYDFSNIKFEDKEIEYDGTYHSIELEGTLPEGVSVNYYGEGRELGNYEVTAIFSGDEENYEPIINLSATLTINKIKVTTPLRDETEFVYNKTLQTYNVTEDPRYTITGTQKLESGLTYVTISLIDKVNSCWDDGTSEDLHYPFNIKKAIYDLSNFKFENTVVEYDGIEHTITPTGTLPEGLSIVVYGSGTNIGTYEIIVFFNPDDYDNYEPLDNLTATLVISQIIVVRPDLDETEFVYNGHDQTYHIAESPFYTVRGNVCKTAGTTEVIISLVEPETTVWDNGSNEDLLYHFTINKAHIDTSNLTMEDEIIDYDGRPHRINVKGTLPAGVTVTYTGSGTNAGSYQIIARFNYDTLNYDTIVPLRATLTINKIVVTRPAKDSTSFTYDGQEKTYNIAKSDLYTIIGDKNVNAGQRHVTIILKDKLNYVWDDNTTSDLDYPFIINKAHYDLSNIKFEDLDIAYDGKAHSLQIEGTLPEGVSVTYENNNKTLSGVYKIRAIFNVDDSNYEDIEPLEATLTIGEALLRIDSTFASIGCASGLPSSYQLQSSLLGFKQEDYKTHTTYGEKVLAVYDITLLDASGNPVELIKNREYTLRIALPEGVNENTLFRIEHIHSASDFHSIRKGTAASSSAFIIQDGYIIFTINQLSEFAIIELYSGTETCNVHIIQAIILSAYVVFFVIWFFLLRKHKFDIVSVAVTLVYTTATIVLALFANCEICILFHIISAAVLVIVIGIYIFSGFLYIKKNPQKIYHEPTEKLYEEDEVDQLVELIIPQEENENNIDNTPTIVEEENNTENVSIPEEESDTEVSNEEIKEEVKETPKPKTTRKRSTKKAKEKVDETSTNEDTSQETNKD